MIAFGRRRQERRLEEERQWRALVGSIPITDAHAKELTRAESWFYYTYVDVEQSRMFREVEEDREVREAFARLNGRDGKPDIMQESWDWYRSLLSPWKPVPVERANLWREGARLELEIARSDDPAVKDELRAQLAEIDAEWERQERKRQEQA
jgi:hypothetical protein